MHESIARPALWRCTGIDPARFGREFWSVAPLLSPAGDLPGTFDDLLTLADVDELVSRRGLRTPFLRIAKNGEVVDPGRFTGAGGVGATIGDQVRDDKVLALFADGSTLVLQGLHRLWPPLIDFAAALGTDLGHPVQINAYITPPQSQGFSAHYDVHDVFVLQLAGTKRWVIHPPVLTAPLRDQPWTDRRAAVAEAAAGEPAIDAVLQPGDALYLPRGWLHAATAQGEVSAHLTVGIHTLTRYTIVQALLAQVAEDPALRASLPLGADPAQPEELAGEVQAVLARLLEVLPAADTAAAVDQVRRQLWSGVRPSPVAPLAQAAAATALTHESAIRLRPHLRHRIEQTAAGIRVVLADRRVDFPSATALAVRRALAGADVAVGTLPGLDTEDRLTLARRLLREGLVVPGLPSPAR